MGRRVLLHGYAAPVPEHRRRDPLPLRKPRHPAGHRRRHQHHLQDPLQRRRGDDRRSARRRCHRDSRPHPRAGGGRRQAHRRAHRRAGALRRGHARSGGRGPRAREAGRGAARAPRDPRRHRAHLRPALRRGSPPQAQTRPGAGTAHAGHHQRADLRGLRRLRGQVELPERAAGGHRVRPEDAGSTSRRATPTTPASRAIVPPSSRQFRSRASRPGAGRAWPGPCRSFPQICPRRAINDPETPTSTSWGSAAPASSRSTRCSAPRPCWRDARSAASTRPG